MVCLNEPLTLLLLSDYNQQKNGEKNLQKVLTHNFTSVNLNMWRKYSPRKDSRMDTDFIIYSEKQSEELISLIKLAIGDRTLRKVEEEAGISHGLLGKVLKGTQKASVDLLHKLTAEEAHPQNGVTYIMLMEAAEYIPPIMVETSRHISSVGALSSYAEILQPDRLDWMKKVKSRIKEIYCVRDSDLIPVHSIVSAFEKIICSDIVVTDKSGGKIWVSFLYADKNNKEITEEAVKCLGRTAFAGADKYLIVVNTLEALQIVGKVKQSLREVDLEVEILLV